MEYAQGLGNSWSVRMERSQRAKSKAEHRNRTEAGLEDHLDGSDGAPSSWQTNPGEITCLRWKSGSLRNKAHWKFFWQWRIFMIDMGRDIHIRTKYTMKYVVTNGFLSILCVPNERLSRETKHQVIKVGQLYSPSPKVNCGDKLVNFCAMLKKCKQYWCLLFFLFVKGSACNEVQLIHNLKSWSFVCYIWATVWFVYCLITFLCFVIFNFLY